VNSEHTVGWASFGSPLGGNFKADLAT